MQSKRVGLYIRIIIITYIKIIIYIPVYVCIYILVTLRTASIALLLCNAYIILLYNIRINRKNAFLNI